MEVGGRRERRGEVRGREGRGGREGNYCPAGTISKVKTSSLILL